MAKKNLTESELEQRKSASRRPRGPQRGKVDPEPDETLDEAIERFQRAKADKEQALAAKYAYELEVEQGKHITKDQAVDVAQAAVLRVVGILDLLPERLRDRVGPDYDHIAEALEGVIHDARQELAK